MGPVPKSSRLDKRFHRSKRSGKIILGGVLLVSLAFGAALTQGLVLALQAGRNDLVVRGFVGLGLLVGLNLFSIAMIRRQHRILDDAREDLEALVRGDPPV
jgi:hypothetical protein